ncbi:MAG: DOMON-like domain-containing protein [Rhodospirillales bacterium]|nr:MAG: DOMON-like domain-containing protein [Rhodospirillales bacterium]
MRRALIAHPDSRIATAMRIAVDIARPRRGDLVLSYAVTGCTRRLSLPAPGLPARGDELWRHTCFEAFLGVGSGPAYYEFNFAPSRRWAAYRFDGYRAGMRSAPTIDPPRLDVRADDDLFEIQVMLRPGDLPDVPDDAALRLGLSAVIEDTGGNLSYWALAHPPGAPDFHHSDCFALQLPAA